jgi:hypothetical protein
MAPSAANLRGFAATPNEGLGQLVSEIARRAIPIIAIPTTLLFDFHRMAASCLQSEGEHGVLPVPTMMLLRTHQMAEFVDEGISQILVCLWVEIALEEIEINFDHPLEGVSLPRSREHAVIGEDLEINDGPLVTRVSPVVAIQCCLHFLAMLFHLVMEEGFHLGVSDPVTLRKCHLVSPVSLAPFCAKERYQIVSVCQELFSHGFCNGSAHYPCVLFFMDYVLHVAFCMFYITFYLAQNIKCDL